MNRTKNYFLQLKSSFFFKILAVGSSFLLIPVCLKYLGHEQYGIWSTILSIMTWVVLFDIGIGNGLRNRITESIAKNDTLTAKGYISTSYTLIALISMFILFVLLFLSNFVSWQIVFNTEYLSNKELMDVVNISCFFLFLNFWLSLINQVFNGLQKSSLVVFNQFLSNFFALITITILYLSKETSLSLLAFSYGISLLISNIILSVWFFIKNKKLLPSIKYYSSKYVKKLISVGSQFFIIQIAVVVVFTTDKILITQLFGPSSIIKYDSIFKLFSIVTIIHTLVLAPLWSAYSDAYHRNDLIWIKRTIINQLFLYIGIIIITAIIAYFAKTIVSIWLMEELFIEDSLVIYMMLFILISTWNNIFAYFVNSIDKLKVQLICSLAAIVINIPLSIFIVKFFSTGIYGIILATCISLSFFAIFGPIQTYTLLKNNFKKI